MDKIIRTFKCYKCGTVFEEEVPDWTGRNVSFASIGICKECVKAVVNA